MKKPISDNEWLGRWMNNVREATTPAPKRKGDHLDGEEDLLQYAKRPRIENIHDGLELASPPRYLSPYDTQQPLVRYEHQNGTPTSFLPITNGFEGPLAQPGSLGRSKSSNAPSSNGSQRPVASYHHSNGAYMTNPLAQYYSGQSSIHSEHTNGAHDSRLLSPYRFEQPGIYNGHSGGISTMSSPLRDSGTRVGLPHPSHGSQKPSPLRDHADGAKSSNISRTTQSERPATHQEHEPAREPLTNTSSPPYESKRLPTYYEHTGGVHTNGPPSQTGIYANQDFKSGAFIDGHGEAFSGDRSGPYRYMKPANRGQELAIMQATYETISDFELYVGYSPTCQIHTWESYDKQYNELQRHLELIWTEIPEAIPKLKCVEGWHTSHADHVKHTPATGDDCPDWLFRCRPGASTGVSCYRHDKESWAKMGCVRDLEERYWQSAGNKEFEKVEALHTSSRAHWY